MPDRAARSSHRHSWCLAFACVAIAGGACALADTPSRQVCDQSPVRSIPMRSKDAPAGSEFARRAQNLSGPARDARILSELFSGNLPAFLRRLAPVTITGSDGTRSVKITVCVLPDYLAVGSDADFVFVPLGLKAALDVAGHFGFTLPTPRLVDAIYDESPVKLQPLPLPASDRMRSTAYVVFHSELINRERAAHAAPLGELTSGDKKDLVLTSLLWQPPGRVAIYGWHRAVNQPIQPLSTVHGARYADYSHGVRLISDAVYVNDVARPLEDVLATPTLAPLLSREGPLPHLRERLAQLTAQLAAAEPTESIAGLPRARVSAPIP
jgi:hypothetical protein